MNGTAIKSIKAHQVYTNRGNPGVEAIVTTENGAVGRAMCTSGISVGTHEVKFQFDGGTKFRGKGVQCAADRINNEIAPKMIGVDAANQLEADRVMLSLAPNAKAAFGGNATRRQLRNISTVSGDRFRRAPFSEIDFPLAAIDERGVAQFVPTKFRKASFH